MQEMIWRTRDGRLYAVYQMETRHIRNCLNLMDRARRRGRRWREEYRERLELELEIRSIGLNTKRFP